MRGSRRSNRTPTYWPPPTLLAITAFLSRSPGLLNRGPGAQPLWDMFLNPAFPLQLVWSPTAQSRARGLPLLGAGFLYRSCLQLVWSPNWLSSLCTELYNSSTPTFFLWASQIALIQPIHGQGYILIFLDRMHLLFTQVHFLFWQLGRVVGQYTTNEYTCVRAYGWYHEKDARCVVVIVVGNEHGGTSSNPGRDWLHFI